MLLWRWRESWGTGVFRPGFKFCLLKKKIFFASFLVTLDQAVNLPEQNKGPEDP